MEALVAIGLTANIAQFVQQASTLILEAKSIRETGSPRSLPELRRLAENLVKQANSIEQCLSASSRKTLLAPEEQNLIETAGDCRTAGQQFISYIDTLIVNTASPDRRRSRYLATSIKLQFKQKKIEDFSAKLEKLRNALTLATISAFRASATTNHEEIIRRLDQSQHERSANDTALQDAIRELSDDIHSGTWLKLDKLSYQLQQYATSIRERRDSNTANSNSAILQWLDFRQISSRYNEIPLAYQETYSWIFKKPVAVGTWDDFAVHLKENVSAPYFINGKAGSGKSTLMKFIVDHKCTKDILSEWAASDNSTLVMAKFFFWNLGTPLQKSRSGLLRGLLKAILSQRPELIEAVFPEVYNTPDDLLDEPTYTELKNAWDLLLQTLGSSLKLAIFIDGVDEFEGDHKDIADFVRSLASARVKVVVSSRPINACLQTFDGCSTIRLQDLTMKDMDTFVQGKLWSHSKMVQLSQNDPFVAEAIISEIKEKADGVFLWVKLVVWLLVQGLENGDTIEDLRRRLRSLPGDLRTLYRHMLSRMSPEHQIQAAEIFQIVASAQVIPKRALHTVTLYFALQPPSSSLKLGITPADTKTLSTLTWYHEQTSARVRSRCCGLLEVRPALGILPSYQNVEDHPRDISPLEDHPLHDYLDSTVTYLHRTVAEYLNSDDIALHLQQLVSPTFKPYENLMAASLCRLKTSAEIRLSGHKIQDHLEYMLQLYQAAPAESRGQLNAYLAALDGTMTYYEHETWFQRGFLGKGHRPQTFLEFSARLGFYQFLKSSPEMVSASATRLVNQALQSWGSKSEIQFEHTSFTVPPLQDRRDTLAFLLQHVVTLQDRPLEQALFESAQKHAVKLKNAHNIFIPIFLVVMRSPDILRGYSTNQWQAMVKYLVESKDPDNESLAHKVSHILTQHPRRDYSDLDPRQGHEYSGLVQKGRESRNIGKTRANMRSRAKQSGKSKEHEEQRLNVGNALDEREEDEGEEWIMI